MKQQRTIDSYIDLYDATVKMEYELERLLNDGYKDDLEGKVTLINGRWRVTVGTAGNQLEFDV